MSILQGANLGLRFLLELTALAIFGYWGWKSGDGAMRWVLAVTAVAATGHRGLGLAFVAVALVSGILNFLWD